MEILATLQPCEFLIPQLVIDLFIYFLYCQNCLLSVLMFLFIQVDGIPNPSKEQLIDVVQRHFVTQVVAKYHTACPLSLLLFPFHLLE